MMFYRNDFDDVQRTFVRYKQTSSRNKRIRIAGVTADDCELVYLLHALHYDTLLVFIA